MVRNLHLIIACAAVSFSVASFTSVACATAVAKPQSSGIAERSGQPPEASPKPTDPPLTSETRDRVRIVLLGDTGMPNAKMRAVAEAIEKVEKDYVLLAGDIVYPDAPPCPSGDLSEPAREVLDRSLGDFLAPFGAPVLLLIGNHDVGHRKTDPAREACILRYAAEKESLHLPGLSWSFDLGVVTIVGLNTNNLDDAQADLSRRVLDDAKGWRLLAGHHVYKTYQDKANERIVRPWVKKHKLKPDMYLNAHAHLHQFGIYDGVLAVTSGATALPRERPTCPGTCGRGQRFGSSEPGFALLDFTADSVSLTFYDTNGATLYETKQSRKAAAR